MSHRKNLFGHLTNEPAQFPPVPPRDYSAATGYFKRPSTDSSKLLSYTQRQP
jgi:hypothetical protein